MGSYNEPEVLPGGAEDLRGFRRGVSLSVAPLTDALSDDVRDGFELEALITLPAGSIPSLSGGNQELLD